MAFNAGGLAFPRLASSHRISGHEARLSLRNLSSCNGGPVTLSTSSAMMRTRSVRLFAALEDQNNEDDQRDDLYEMMQAVRDRLKKVASVVQVEAVRAQKQLSTEEHVGYSEDELVKAVLNGVHAPVRIEISDAALKLGTEKLNRLVHEAYKNAHENTILSMKNKMSNISTNLGIDEDLGDELPSFIDDVIF